MSAEPGIDVVVKADPSLAPVDPSFTVIVAAPAKEPPLTIRTYEVAAVLLEASTLLIWVVKPERLTAFDDTGNRRDGSPAVCGEGCNNARRVQSATGDAGGAVILDLDVARAASMLLPP